MTNYRPEIESQAAIELTRQAVGGYASAWLAGDHVALVDAFLA